MLYVYCIHNSLYPQVGDFSVRSDERGWEDRAFRISGRTTCLNYLSNARVSSKVKNYVRQITMILDIITKQRVKQVRPY